MCGCGFRCRILIGLSTVILIIAYLFNPFNPLPPSAPPPDYSYDHRIDFNLEDVRIPTTHEQIVQVVREAHDNHKKVRVVAAGHSWSEIAQTEDIMISLHEYTGVEVHRDTEPPTATVKAGTSLRNISLFLDQESVGLAMINLGSVAAQSIAGAISTATHGTGLEIGNLASLVTKVKFVSGTGETVVLSEEDEDTSRFKAAVVSIGMFGVLSEVTIRVSEAFYLEENRTSTTLQDCLENLDSLVEGHEYVKMWVDFHNNFCSLYQTKKTDSTEIKNRPGRLESFLTYYSFAFSTRLTKLIPSVTFTKFMMKLVDTIGLQEHLRVDKSYLIFNDYFELPIHQESEIIVPYSDSVALVQTIEEVAVKHPVNYITEVRFVSGDNNHLSPQYGMDEGSCAVTLTIYGNDDVVHSYFDEVYEKTRKFKGRIHWGKHFSHANRRSFEEWYPKFKQFAKFRKEYDPEDIFVNEFIKDKFDF